MKIRDSAEKVRALSTSGAISNYQTEPGEPGLHPAHNGKKRMEGVGSIRGWHHSDTCCCKWEGINLASPLSHSHKVGWEQ